MNSIVHGKEKACKMRITSNILRSVLNEHDLEPLYRHTVRLRSLRHDSPPKALSE